MTGLEHDHPVAGRERVRQRRLPGPSSRRRIDHDHILGLEDSFHPGDDLLPEGPEFGAAMVNRRHRDRPQHPVGDIGRPGNLQKMAAGMHGGGVLHRDGAPWKRGFAELLTYTVASHTPGTLYASASPGHGGIVTLSTVRAPRPSQRNWKRVPVGIVIDTPGPSSTVSSCCPNLRHMRP